MDPRAEMMERIRKSRVVAQPVPEIVVGKPGPCKRPLPTRLVVQKPESEFRKLLTRVSAKPWLDRKPANPVVTFQKEPVARVDRCESINEDWTDRIDAWKLEEPEDADMSPGREFDADLLPNPPAFKAAKLKQMYEDWGLGAEEVSKLVNLAEDVETQLLKTYAESQEPASIKKKLRRPRFAQHDSETERDNSD